MKSIFLTLTTALQFLLLYTLKLLDSFWLIIVIFIISMVIGVQLNSSKKEEERTMINNLGWGLLYGSLISLGGVIVFIVWLTFNFPR